MTVEMQRRKVKRKMVKTNCFAWNDKVHRCKILRKTLCENGPCDFFKTKGTECKGCFYDKKDYRPTCHSCPHSQNKVVMQDEKINI